MGFHLPFFPWYAAETIADGRIQAWPLEAYGAWQKLLSHNWNDLDIPASTTELARLLRITHQEMVGIWTLIGDRFVEVPDRPGRLWSPRLEAEREKALALSRTRSVVGKKGANARWHKEKKPHGKRMPLPSVCHSPGNAEAMPKPCPQQSPSPSPSQSPNSSASADVLVPPPTSLTERQYPGFWKLYSEAQEFCPGISVPRSPEVRDAIEANVARLTLPVAISVCRGVAAKAKESIGNVAYFVDALHKHGRETARPNGNAMQPVGQDWDAKL